MRISCRAEVLKRFEKEEEDRWMRSQRHNSMIPFHESERRWLLYISPSRHPGVYSQRDLTLSRPGPSPFLLVKLHTERRPVVRN